MLATSRKTNIQNNTRLALTIHLVGMRANNSVLIVVCLETQTRTSLVPLVVKIMFQRFLWHDKRILMQEINNLGFWIDDVPHCK